MKAFAGLILSVAALLLGACNKNSDSTSAGPAAPATSPADYGGVLEKSHHLAVTTADLSSVNNALQQFNAAEGRFPKDLNELLAMKYLPRLPAPPAGMDYTYDPASGRAALAPK